MATTTDLEKLVINYLTQDQYDDAREAGTLNANELYLTPDTGSTGGTVTSVAVANGGALSVSGSPITTSGTITISHADTSSQSSVSNSGRTYIQSVTLDTYGHVTGLTSATETVTNSDEKLGTDAVTSGTTYYIVAGTNTTGAERKKYDASGIAYKATNGTANGTNGEALLTLGNSTASTSANWKAGKIFLYSSSAYGGTLVPEAVTSSSKTWTLPNKTGTIALTSDIPDTSSFITVDEKLKWTASTSTNTYYPLQSTSTATTSTANTLNGISFYQYYNTAGGYRRLILGNTTAYTSTGGAYGTIRLYGTSATYYGDLNPGTIGSNSLTANRTWTLPDKTGTIALTSDIPDVSGFITTDSDKKLEVAAITSGTTYYPIVGTGTTAATRQYDTTGFVYTGTNGTANGSNGNALLTLGNSTASTTANWKKGTVRLYGTTTYYTDLVSGAPSANRTITFPNATGTVALTSDIPTVPTKTSDLTNDSGFITNDSDKKLEVELVTSNTVYYPIVSNGPSAAIRQYDSAGFEYSSESGTSSTVGKARLTLGNSIASGTANNKQGRLIIFGSTAYEHTIMGAPTAARILTLPDKTGTIALTSDIPDMSDYAGLDDLPTITLNGTETTSPNFYAPTSAGTNGYVLKSNGSGAPTWTSATLTDENVKSTAIASAMTNYIVGSTTSTTTTGGLSKHDSAILYTTANSDTGGYTQLRLGNGTATSSAGGKEGQIRLYGTNATYYITLRPGALTTPNKTITFPDATGTLALTSDLDGYLPLTGGDLSGNLRLNADSGVGRWVTTRQNDASVMSSGVGTSGIHGLYSEKGGRWMIQAPADGSSVTINDGINSNTYIAGMLYINGHYTYLPTENTSSFYYASKTYTEDNTEKTVQVGFGCGSNGGRHGVYSSSNGKWIIMHDGTDLYLDGTSTNNKITAWVNESGLSNSWRYRKFSDGTFDAWGTFSVTPTSSTASGNIYYSNSISITLPFSAAEDTSVYATGTVGSQYAWIVNTASAATTISFRIARGTTISTTTAVSVRLHIHGRY